MEIVSEHHTEEGTKSDSATAGTVMRTRKKVEAFLKAAAGMSWENAALTLGLPSLPHHILTSSAHAPRSKHETSAKLTPYRAKRVGILVPPPSPPGVCLAAVITYAFFARSLTLLYISCSRSISPFISLTHLV